jgi:hypothetical protein
MRSSTHTLVELSGSIRWKFLARRSLTALFNHVMSIGLSAVPFGGFRVQSAVVWVGLVLERQNGRLSFLILLQGDGYTIPRV